MFTLFVYLCGYRIYSKMARQGYKNRIRVVLAERQITNRVLADSLGVNEVTISRWTTNKNQPSMSQFVEISKFLNVDIKELIEVNPMEISGEENESNYDRQ